MFNVSVVNLAPDARSATEGGGARDIGRLSEQELIGLLETFAELDAVQNNDADPEIWVQARRERYVIRTGSRKLFLQNARNLSEPAYTLTAREIIEELDGTAAARRTTPPMPMAISSTPFSETPFVGTDSGLETAPAPEEPEGRPRLIGLIVLVVLLGGYIAYSELTRRPAGPPAVAPLTAIENAAEDALLTGAYMTGTEPGQHGIVVLGGGKLEIFQVNTRGGPGTVFATYTIGRKDAGLCLVTDQPGGLITVTGPESLEFCGETYKRIRNR